MKNIGGMLTIKRIKEYFKALKTVVKHNLFGGFICPECSMREDYDYHMPSEMYFLRDEKYHKYKYYIKCHNCEKTTPALDTPKEALEMWDDYFIDQECKIMENV